MMISKVATKPPRTTRTITVQTPRSLQNITPISRFFNNGVSSTSSGSTPALGREHSKNYRQKSYYGHSSGSNSNWTLTGGVLVAASWAFWSKKEDEEEQKEPEPPSRLPPPPPEKRTGSKNYAAIKELNKSNPPPEGFEWRSFPKFGVSMMVPRTWYVVERPDAEALVLSEQDIENDPEDYSVGVVIWVFPKLVTNDADDIVEGQRMTYQKEGFTSKETDYIINEDDNIKHYTMHWRDATPPPVLMENKISINKNTGTLYNFVFEAPEKNWKKAQEKFSVISQSTVLKSDM